MNWRIQQKEKLLDLKEKDLKDMRKIAKRLGTDSDIMRHFQEIVERRYENINKLFDENIQAVKTVLAENIDSIDEGSLLKTFEQRKRLADQLIEEQKNTERLEFKNNELERVLSNVVDSEKSEKYFGNYSNNDETEKSVRVSELEIEPENSGNLEENKANLRGEINDIDGLSPCLTKRPGDISSSFIEQIKSLQLHPVHDNPDRYSPENESSPVMNFILPQIFTQIISDNSEPQECESSQSFRSFQGEIDIQNLNTQEFSKSFEDGLNLHDEIIQEAYEIMEEAGSTPYREEMSEGKSKNNAIYIQE